jgi:hypothetical protein
MSINFGSVTEDQSKTDYELMERMHKIDEDARRKDRERHEKRVDELRKAHNNPQPRTKRQQQEEEEQEQPPEESAAFRASHWICARTRTAIDRKNEGAIQEHRESCPVCIENRENAAAQTQARVDGFALMRGVLWRITKCEEEIEGLKRKIQKERENQLQNWEIAVKKLEDNIKSEQYTIERQLGVELRKLLEHENEITRQAARELYEKYLNCSEKDKRAGPNKWK